MENARDRAREEALLAVGAGASAVHFSAYPEGAEQRCWNHRLMNVTDHLPKKVGPEAKAWLRKIPYADSRRECERLRDQIVECYGKLCPKAVDTLCRDWERMVSFCSFPMEHWCHLERPTW
ncbi:MAG: transposase [Chloroflexi bacterium]|nr:transposase [Chloroflexota bacterium]